MEDDNKPTLLPARMLNEFVYCPRLFYYEFVEKVFVHNADTLEGAAQHKRVDQSKSNLPSAKKRTKKEAATEPEATEVSEAPQSIHAHSVELYSEKLRVNAKLDLVEGATDLASGKILYQPVEYKRGHPREGDEGNELWPADKMQLGVQILLLRENGYHCDTGIVYYRETRQRVRFDMDTPTEQWIVEQIDAARACTQGAIPPPLDDSPKCPRCSLVGFCLPDETRMLAEFTKPDALPESAQLDFAMDLPEMDDRIEEGPFGNIPEIQLPAIKPGQDLRRLIAPGEDTRTLYLHTPGMFVGKKGDLLQAKEKKGKDGKSKVAAEFLIKDLHHLALFGPIQVSTGVIQALCEVDIPITYFSMGGWFYGMTRGHSLKNVFTRIEQFRHAADSELALTHARLFVHGKIRNQRTLLMRNHLDAPKQTLRQMKWAAGFALTANSIPSLLGIEGAAAQAYFGQFSGMIKHRAESPRKADQDAGQQVQFPFDFTGRNRRPPRDPVNALLSLAYSLLSRDATLAAYSAGFDPYVGFYHQPRFGRPALALDLMEEFRPIIAESVVLTLINNGMLQENDFYRAGESVTLTPRGRKTFFFAYEKRINSPITHPIFGYQVSYRRALELQFRLLARVLTGEIEQYLPFTIR
ncbi:MAG: CRISPR-associated endonuclease Cas1 [Verrucomicrobia bacterium]|jgi:CRISPR-associated protein Cas1|nr:CRISPR-associated endonuclease Cas1 [Verrucomicrobiota bacterium]